MARAKKRRICRGSNGKIVSCKKQKAARKAAKSRKRKGYKGYGCGC